MHDFGDWKVEQYLATLAPPEARLCWRDQATELTISRLTVGSDVTGYRLQLSDLAVDVVSAKRVIVRPAPCLAQITIDHFLADQVLPRLLASEGSLVVHAGAVRVGSSAVIVLGHSGRGKSTLTASFDRAGHDLLGDDAMVISFVENRHLVHAVYRSLRLFPDSIAELMAGATTAGPVAHFTDKERIDVAIEGQMTADPLPVAAMFALAAAANDGDITTRPLTASETCMMLVEGSFALDPSDTAQARQRLDQASAVASAVPAFEICYPRDYACLPEVRQAILDQVAALEAA